MEMMLRNAGDQTSPEEVLKQLQSCQLNQIGVKQSPHTSLTITEMTEQQKHWVKVIPSEKYLKAKAMKQLTESIKQTL